MNALELSPLATHQRPVLLTPIAYDHARQEGIVSVAQDTLQVAAVRIATGTGEEFTPDLTIVRWNTGFRPSTWDRRFADMPDITYHIAHDIPEVGFNEKGVVPAREVRAAQYAGARVVELTVKGWDGWGSALAEAFFDAKEAAGGLSPEDALNRASTAVGAAIGMLGVPVTPRARTIKAAGQLRPYLITRRERPAIADGRQ